MGRERTEHGLGSESEVANPVSFLKSERDGGRADARRGSRSRPRHEWPGRDVSPGSVAEAGPHSYRIDRATIRYVMNGKAPERSGADPDASSVRGFWSGSARLGRPARRRPPGPAPPSASRPAFSSLGRSPRRTSSSRRCFRTIPGPTSFSRSFRSSSSDVGQARARGPYHIECRPIFLRGLRSGRPEACRASRPVFYGCLLRAARR